MGTDSYMLVLGVSRVEYYQQKQDEEKCNRDDLKLYHPKYNIDEICENLTKKEFQDPKPLFTNIIYKMALHMLNHHFLLSCKNHCCGQGRNKKVNSEIQWLKLNRVRAVMSAKHKFPPPRI